MAQDFRDASKRHWEDAEFLLVNARLANADHLYGLSAECALKAVMHALGMILRSDGVPKEKDHQKHANGIWEECYSFLQKQGGAHYSAMLGGRDNPFSGWHVSQRYAHRADILPENVHKHQIAAKTALRILQEALLRGDV